MASRPALTLGAPLLLGSASPRRAQLLRELGLGFEVQVRPVEEPPPPPGRSPADHALETARLKLAAYADRFASHLVLTADTVVADGERALGKPRDAADAVEMLTALAGRQHEVISAVCLAHRDARRELVCATRVELAPLPETWIRAYVERCQPLDKAGAYGIQEWFGLGCVRRIEGDLPTVIGLPTAPLLPLLDELAGLQVS